MLVKAPHWERVFLSEVATVQNGFAFKSSLFTNGEGKPLIRIRDIDKGETENHYLGEFSDEYLVNRGDILIGMDGDFKAARWEGQQGLLNQRVCRVLFESEYYSEDFLFLCLQPYLNAINAETSSITVKHLSSRTVNEIPLPLPPLNEQRRIVAKIEALFAELDAGVASLKKAQAQLKTYRQALLKHAFSGKLTEQWRAENGDQLEDAAALLQRIRAERQARYVAEVAAWEENGRQGQKPRPPKDLPPLTPAELEELPQLPAGWIWVRFGELIETIRGGTTAVPQDLPTNFPILRSSSVRAGKIDYSDVRYLIEEQIKDHNDFVNQGNLLFTRLNGTIDYVGNCAVVGSNFPENLMYPDRLYCAKLTNMESGKFYEQVFSSPYVRRKIEKTAKSSAGHRRISISDITNLPVPTISLSESRHIINQIESRFSVIDQLEQTITIALQQAEALRQSILKKAFSGQLVPQDPADEPTAVLLARIRAAKP